jgi:hypothetical protein
MQPYKRAASRGPLTRSSSITATELPFNECLAHLKKVGLYIRIRY